MNTVRLSLRQRLERRTGVLLLALTVAVFWACLVAAHVMGQRSAMNVVVSRSQLAGVHGLWITSTSEAYRQVEVIYEDRDDVSISGLLSTDPAWRVDGADLVLTSHAHNIEVRLPQWINRLEGRNLDIKNTIQEPPSQLTLTTREGRLDGVFQSIDLTMGSPNCAAGLLSRPVSDHFYVKNARVAQLRIKTASGHLSLKNIDSIKQIQLSAMPGVELSLDDANQLPRLEFNPLDETTIKATHWMSDPCELN